ncbi:MAG: tetratricopeptide repeat protein [Chloroflexi bacterium]|nr:tetratricopeptide repeat protein [Chloroflexota bacterium]
MFYNQCMKFVQQFLIGILLLFPVGLGMILPLSPLPEEFILASETLQQTVGSGKNELDLESLQTMLEFSPWRGDVWQRLGRIQLSLGRYSEAVKSFSNAEASGQLTAEGILWMADGLISLGEPGQAIVLLREVSSTPDVGLFTLLQASLLQRNLHDPQGVLSTLLQGYSLEPWDPEVNYQLGLQLSASKPEEGIKYLAVASSLSDDRASICKSLISMIVMTAKVTNPGERFKNIGQVLSTLGELEVAQIAFQSAVDLDPGNAAAWALLAEAVQQNDQDGLQYLKKAQELSPDDEIVNGLTALYYRRQGKSALALTYLEKAIAANPRAAIWEIEVAKILADEGDLASALTRYQKAVQINPRDWVPQRALAIFCIATNYELETFGLPAARIALELNPESPAILDLLGAGLMLAGDLDSAESYFLRADHLDSQQSAILIHLGQLYLAKGDRSLAFEYLRRAAEFATESRLREMANRLLEENGGGG